MGFFDDLFSFFGHSKWAGLPQSEKEAMVDALVLVMMVDHETNPTEQTLFLRDVEDIHWEGEKPIETYVQDLVLSFDNPELTKHLGPITKDIAARISGEELAEAVYLMAHRLAEAGNPVDSEEALCLANLGIALQFTREQQRALIATLKED